MILSFAWRRREDRLLFKELGGNENEDIEILRLSRRLLKMYETECVCTMQQFGGWVEYI